MLFRAGLLSPILLGLPLPVSCSGFPCLYLTFHVCSSAAVCVHAMSHYILMIFHAVENNNFEMTFPLKYNF